MLKSEQIFANNPVFLPLIWICVRQSRPPWRDIVLHFIAKQKDVDKDPVKDVDGDDDFHDDYVTPWRTVMVMLKVF